MICIFVSCLSPLGLALVVSQLFRSAVDSLPHIGVQREGGVELGWFAKSVQQLTCIHIRIMKRTQRSSNLPVNKHIQQKPSKHSVIAYWPPLG